jgi:hypothetical protein
MQYKPVVISSVVVAVILRTLRPLYKLNLLQMQWKIELAYISHFIITSHKNTMSNDKLLCEDSRQSHSQVTKS